ncbi:MAG: hypothetical protein V7765_07770 [Oleispira sp.]
MTTSRTNYINKEQIISLIEQDHTNAYIAQVVGCHRNTVSRAKKNRRTRERTAPQSSQHRDERILALNNRGLSNTAIARNLNCSSSTVAKSLKVATQTALMNRITPLQHEMLRLRNLGYSQTQIGEKVGRHRNTVSRNLRGI